MLIPKEEKSPIKKNMKKKSKGLSQRNIRSCPRIQFVVFVECDQSGTGKSRGRSMSVVLECVVPGPAKAAAAASPGNLIPLQILKPNRRSVRQKLGRRETQQSVFSPARYTVGAFPHTQWSIPVLPKSVGPYSPPHLDNLLKYS